MHSRFVLLISLFLVLVLITSASAATHDVDKVIKEPIDTSLIDGTKLAKQEKELRQEIIETERNIRQLRQNQDSFPAGQTSQTHQIQREIQEQEQKLLKQQKDLNNLLHIASTPTKISAPELTKIQRVSLSGVSELWKEGKEAEAVAGWKNWLKKNKRPDVNQPFDLERLAHWLARQNLQDTNERVRIEGHRFENRLLEAAKK
jgi:hypothetical protein